MVSAFVYNALTANEWLALLFFTLVAEVPFAIGCVTMSRVKEVYEKYDMGFKMAATVFGLLWFLMYGLVGAAGFFLWQTYDTTNAYYISAITLWAVTILLASAWPILFFGLGWVRSATTCAVWLFLVSAATMSLFYIESLLAGGLMTGIVAWEIFTMIHSFDACDACGRKDNRRRADGKTIRPRRTDAKYTHKHKHNSKKEKEMTGHHVAIAADEEEDTNTNDNPDGGSASGSEGSDEE